LQSAFDAGYAKASRRRKTSVRFGVRNGPVSTQPVAAHAVGNGAGGRTRTDTTFYSPRILSPVRLPFRHTGNPAHQSLTRFTIFEIDTCATVCAAIATGTTPISHKRHAHAGTFAKVIDGNKQPIRGLWVRNGRFYAQLKLVDPTTGEKKTRCGQRSLRRRSSLKSEKNLPAPFHGFVLA
jgi:hypothetical protein